MSRAICLACRTVFADPQPCDGGAGHRVVDLGTPAGRSEIARETWGHSARRRRLRRIIREGQIGSGKAPSDRDRDTKPLRAVELLAPLVFVMSAVYVVITEIGDRLTDRHRRWRFVRPFGAQRPPLSPKGTKPVYGVARGEPSPSPLRDEACLAYVITLRTRSPANRLQRDLWREAAVPSGFVVDVDGGDVVRVPPGPVWFHANPDTEKEASVERATERLGPGLTGASEDGLLLFPFDEAIEDVVRPGDRVVVLGALRRVEDPFAARASPRGPSASVLVATRPVALRRL